MQGVQAAAGMNPITARHQVRSSFSELSRTMKMIICKRLESVCQLPVRKPGRGQRHASCMLPLITEYWLGCRRASWAVQMPEMNQINIASIRPPACSSPMNVLLQKVLLQLISSWNILYKWISKKNAASNGFQHRGENLTDSTDFK